MKKQNLNNKLAFNKSAVTELNDEQMHHVDGGTSPTAASSLLCLRVASAVVATIVAWVLD